MFINFLNPLQGSTLPLRIDHPLLVVLDAVISLRFSVDYFGMLFVLVVLLSDSKWVPAVPIFFKLNPKINSCIYIFDYV